MSVVLQAYECTFCPGEGFDYTPGDCRRCDRRLQPMGAVA